MWSSVPDSEAAIKRLDPASRRLVPFAVPPDRQLWFQLIGFGLDGHLYVSQDSTGIHRFHGVTGEHLGVVIPVDETSEYNWPKAKFGPDGKLYLATATQGVLRYDPLDGALLGTFVNPGAGGLADVRTMSFGDDGFFYINSHDAAAILRYDINTGDFIDTFIKYPFRDSWYRTGDIVQVVPEPSGVLVAGALALSIRRGRRRRIPPPNSLPCTFV